MPDKFENATLGAKKEQKFSVHMWKRIICSASTLQRFIGGTTALSRFEHAPESRTLTSVKGTLIRDTAI